MTNEIQKETADHGVVRPLTKGRIARAFVVAVVVDLIQLPVNLAYLTGIFAIPAEAMDLGLDIAASVMISKLIGFHWVFLPSFLVESIPGVDLCPTWVTSVAYVSWRRRKQPAVPPPITATVIEPETVPGLRKRLTS